MNKKRKKFYIKEISTLFVFLVILYFGFFANLFFPSRDKISELENRKLTDFPEMHKEELLSGEFFTTIESYYSDHFFQREDIVKWAYEAKKYRGFMGKDQVQLVNVTNQDQFVQQEKEETEGKKEEVDHQELLPEENLEVAEKIIENVEDLSGIARVYAQKEIQAYVEEKDLLMPLMDEIESASTDEESYIEEMTITEEENLEGHKDNGVLIVNDTCYEIFGYSKKSCEYYANAINNFASNLDSTTQVYSLVVPSQIEFIKSNKYRDMAQSQAEAINYINSYLSEEVKAVNAYEPLAEHSEEYLYFRSDHHWTALGAYYAYTAYAKRIGDQPYGLESFNSYEVEGFLGTLYNKTLNTKVGNNPDTVTVYEPFVEHDYTIYTAGGGKLNWDLINKAYAKIANKYMMFMSGDNPLAIIDTALDNGKKALVFKDSYGNAFVPFLLSHYDEIHIIDPRHYQKGAISYAKENEIDDVLFLNYAVVIAGHTGFAENIYRVSY